MNLLDRCRLPHDFDPAPLAVEVAALPPEAWSPHFNTQQYEGDWSGVALRAAVGSPVELYPDPTSTEHAPTEWLAACPSTAAVLDALPYPLLTARFLRLGPASRILAHRDYRLGAADGEARLHLPIVSGDGVGFTLAGAPVELLPGTCWYLDLGQTHEAVNDGTNERIHLVVDVTATDRLLAELRP